MAPALPFVRRPVAAHLRAASIACGGGLLGLLAVALSERALSSWSVWVWAALVLFSAGLGLRFGHPEPPARRAHLLGRALSVLALGGAQLAGTLRLVVWAFPLHEGVALFVSLGALGASIVLVAIAFTPVPLTLREGPGAPLDEAPEPSNAPRDEPGRVFALTPIGPPVSAEESERDAPAVEVRILWGGDLLRVVHLDPPRPFHLGGAGDDLAVDASLSGARSWPLIAVDAAGPSVLAPPSASGAVGVGAVRHGALDLAVAAGAARAGAEGTRIPLAPGTRVILTLPGNAGRAYRAPGEQEGAARAPLVLEIALVRAGKVVGRGLRLGEARRFALITALLGAATLGALRAIPIFLVPLSLEPEPGSLSVERTQLVRALLEAAQGADGEAFDDRFRSNMDWGPLFEGLPPFVEEPLADFDRSRRDARCSSDGHAPWMEPELIFCTTEVVTPYGLRRLGPPAMPDLFGRELRDTWAFHNPEAQAAAYLPLTRRLRITSAANFHGRPVEGAPRLVRAHRGRLRLCFADALQHTPELAGTVHLYLLAGVDGVVTRTYRGGDLADPRLLGCLDTAFTGAQLSPLPQGAVSFEAVMVLGRR